MAVKRYQVDEFDRAFRVPTFDTKCFYCAERVGRPMVYWISTGSTIALHPDCAESLSRHLLSDSENANNPVPTGNLGDNETQPEYDR